MKFGYEEVSLKIQTKLTKIDRCVITTHTRCPVRYVATDLSQARSLHSDRAIVSLGRYRPSDRPARSLHSDQARAKAQSLRSDQAIVPLGRYVTTELEPKLGLYVATERSSRSVATCDSTRNLGDSSRSPGSYLVVSLKREFGIRSTLLSFRFLILYSCHYCVLIAWRVCEFWFPYPSNTFWDFIANGNFTPVKAYQSQIRNLELRVIAKIISNFLFAKDQTSKVINGELQTCMQVLRMRSALQGLAFQFRRS
ncbi:hypothetical protein F2Q69_00027638 [Brassica cretica]|uniref:Arabidopsis retrotransposon Orf1 C-terminal domain-containing protein n=1 Tax=Brassica cretica TaxID=69181 RepID=A0A8S9S181_BRACR|nr:hypothetical protein F2Q69_00027638 [Brassica cretica]